MDKISPNINEHDIKSNIDWKYLTYITNLEKASTNSLLINMELNLYRHKIKNVPDPINPDDLANIRYIQTLGEANDKFIPISGTTPGKDVTGNIRFQNKTGMTNVGNISLATGSKITNLQDALYRTDGMNVISTKNKASELQTTFIELDGGMLTGNLNMDGFKVTNIPADTQKFNLISVSRLKEIILSTTGTSPTADMRSNIQFTNDASMLDVGVFSVSSTRVTSVPDPIEETNLINMGYMQNNGIPITGCGPKLITGDVVFNGVAGVKDIAGLDMNNQVLTGLSEASAPQEVASKESVLTYYMHRHKIYYSNGFSSRSVLDDTDISLLLTPGIILGSADHEANLELIGSNTSILIRKNGSYLFGYNMILEPSSMNTVTIMLMTSTDQVTYTNNVQILTYISPTQPSFSGFLFLFSATNTANFPRDIKLRNTSGGTLNILELTWYLIKL